MIDDKESLACIPKSVDQDSFNPTCVLPYGLETNHIHQAMNDFLDFLRFINQQLHKGYPSPGKFLDAGKF